LAVVTSTATRLEQVQTAIAAAEKAQSYGTGDIRIQKALLKDLYAQEEKLLAQYNREQGNRGIVTRPNFADGL